MGLELGVLVRGAGDRFDWEVRRGAEVLVSGRTWSEVNAVSAAGNWMHGEAERARREGTAGPWGGGAAAQPVRSVRGSRPLVAPPPGGTVERGWRRGALAFAE